MVNSASLLGFIGTLYLVYPKPNPLLAFPNSSTCCLLTKRSHHFLSIPWRNSFVLFVLQYSCQVLDTWILMTFWNPALLSILRALIPSSHLYKHKRPNWSFWFDLSNLLSTCGQRLFRKHKSITWRKQQPFYVSWREDSHRPRLSEWSQQLAATRGSAGSSKGRRAPPATPWAHTQQPPDCGELHRPKVPSSSIEKL